MSQLTQADLIDAYQMLVIPIVLGEGVMMFNVVKKTMNVLTKARAFRNGKGFLVYEPNA